jgi:integrase
MKNNYTFTLTSLNKLLEAFRSGTENRRRINIEGMTGLIANRKGTKNTGTYIEFTYSYRNSHTKKMVYIPVGRYEETKINLIEIDKLWMNAKATKQTLPKVPQPQYTPPIIANAEQGRPQTLHTAFTVWKKTKFGKYSDSTRMYYTRHIESLMKSFPSINTHDIKEAHVRDIITKIKKSALENSNEKRPRLANKLGELSGNSSANQAIATYKIFFDFCISRQWCHNNPTQHIEKRPTNDNTRAGIEITNPNNVSDLVRYLQYIAHTPPEHDDPQHPDYLRTPCTHKKRLYRLMLFTGMRAGEWRLMRVQDIEFADPLRTTAIATIPRGRAKARKTVEIPLSATATLIIKEQMNCTGYTDPDDLLFPREAQKYFMRSPHNQNLTDIVKNQPYKDSAIPQLHERLCNKCHVKYFKPHGLRHMFITTAALLGVDELTQRRLTSHSDGQKDAHSKFYNHFNYLDSMIEASSRVATFFNYFTTDHNNDTFEDFDDLKLSGKYWMSYAGQQVMKKYKMKIEGMFELIINQDLVAGENTGLKDAVKNLAEGYSKEEIMQILRSLA